MRPNLGIIYSMLRFLNLFTNKGAKRFRHALNNAIVKSQRPVSIYSAHLTVICANRGTLRKKTQKNIWLRKSCSKGVWIE